MPGYKAHMTGGAVLAGGVLAGVWWFGLYEPTPLQAAALVAIGMLAALFPDVDTSSRGRQFYYGLLAFTDIVLITNQEFEWAALLGFFAMLPAIDNHRGWTHTWWAMLLTPLPIILIPATFFDFSWEPLLPYYAAAVTGYCSHLIMDKVF